MANTDKVTIRELGQSETNKLLADDIFKRFFPVRCNSCGINNGFNRCIFHITGIRQNKRADEAMQKMLEYHFLYYHKIKHVFFRNHFKKFYADSASCLSCKSTSIVFDISPDYHDYVMAEYTKTLGDNIIQFKGKG